MENIDLNTNFYVFVLLVQRSLCCKVPFLLLSNFCYFLIEKLQTISNVFLFAYNEDDEEEPVQPDKDELQNTLKTLGGKIDDLRASYELICKHGSSLQKLLVDVEQVENASDLASKVKPINERATVFRVTSAAMINVSTLLLIVLK